MKSCINILYVTVVLGMMLSCTPKEQPSTEPTLVEVSAIYNAETEEHLFQTDTDTIPSGWTTFRFTNSSPMVHFLILELMPGERTSEDSKKEIVPPFQEAMDLINAGQAEEGMAKLGELPEWFSDVVYHGGPGFTSPGRTSESTVYMEPGNYVLECYIKTADGTFHSSLGMLRDLRVTEDSTNATGPENPSVEINLSNDGFDVNGDLTPGQHLVAVHFNEEEPPLLANDVQVVRLNEDTNIDSLISWMDWSQPKGLVSTEENPAPVEFLGGTHEMPKGNTAYFKVELTPGRYAWISERSAADPMYKEFSVPEQE